MYSSQRRHNSDVALPRVRVVIRNQSGVLAIVGVRYVDVSSAKTAEGVLAVHHDAIAELRIAPQSMAMCVFHATVGDTVASIPLHVYNCHASIVVQVARTGLWIMRGRETLCERLVLAPSPSPPDAVPDGGESERELRLPRADIPVQPRPATVPRLNLIL